MKHVFSSILISCLLVSTAPAIAQSPQAKLSARTPETATRARIVKNAPIVFLGRSVLGQYFKDSNGRIYRTTVMQVMQVLRGNSSLQPGTVELVDTIAVQDADLKTAYDFGGVEAYEQNYGIYFCTTSTTHSQSVPYQTSNAPLQVKLVENDTNAALLVRFGADGYSISGLYRAWPNQQAIIEYINSLPDMQRMEKLGTYQDYPPISFHDKRLGANDIFDLSQNSKDIDFKPLDENAYLQELRKSTSSKITPTPLPLTARPLPSEVIKKGPD